MRNFLIILSLLILIGFTTAQAPGPTTISTTRLPGSAYANREWKRIMRAAEGIESEARKQGVNLRSKDIYIRLSIEKE